MQDNLRSQNKTYHDKTGQFLGPLSLTWNCLVWRSSMNLSQASAKASELELNDSGLLFPLQGAAADDEHVDDGDELWKTKTKMQLQKPQWRN